MRDNDTHLSREPLLQNPASTSVLRNSSYDISTTTDTFVYREVGVGVRDDANHMGINQFDSIFVQI